MTTAPFNRPTVAPPSPCWVVRMPPSVDAIEIVYVGQANRAELDAAIERLARWGWNFEDDGEVTILADIHADPIGVRLSHLSSLGEADGLERVTRIVYDLLGGATIAEADHCTWRTMNRKRG